MSENAEQSPGTDCPSCGHDIGEQLNCELCGAYQIDGQWRSSARDTPAGSEQRAADGGPHPPAARWGRGCGGVLMAVGATMIVAFFLLAALLPTYEDLGRELFVEPFLVLLFLLGVVLTLLGFAIRYTAERKRR